MMTFLLIFVSILLMICLCFFAADMVPVFLTWVKRIHIGRYTDKKAWYENAEKVAVKQTEKLPPIAVTDRTAYTLVPRLKGEYFNKKFSAWQVGSLLKVTGKNETARSAAYRFFEENNLTSCEYTPGTAMLLYALIENGFDKDEKVVAAADDYCKKALAAAGEGTLPYNVGQPEKYVDVLGMVCPFLIKYHQTYGCPEAFELAKRQFDEFYMYGINERTGMPVHSFKPESGIPLGVYGWGRGCGWLALALDECIGLLDGKDDYAEVLKARAVKLIESLLPYQNNDGSFNALVGVFDSRHESSATAMIGGLFARMGYRNDAEKCLKYLMGVTRVNGEVDFAQGDTMGIGNYSRRFEPMPAAQAFALALYNKIV